MDQEQFLLKHPAIVCMHTHTLSQYKTDYFSKRNGEKWAFRLTEVFFSHPPSFPQGRRKVIANIVSQSGSKRRSRARRMSLSHCGL